MWSSGASTRPAIPEVVALFGQAEVDGLEAELDWVYLGSAFDAFAQAGAPPSGSLLVSMSVGLHLDRFPPDIQRVVARAESSMRVFIEVNDTALAADPAGVLATVDPARELGWGVSVDDVGSSPGCLAVLPLVSADVVMQLARALGATVGQGYHLGAAESLGGTISAPRASSTCPEMTRSSASPSSSSSPSRWRSRWSAPAPSGRESDGR